MCLEVIEIYARNNTNRLTTDSTAEEDAFQDILLLMQLLNNLLNKDLFILIKSNNREQPSTTTPADIFLRGLDMLMPLMTIDLLKFPSLCYE